MTVTKTPQAKWASRIEDRTRLEADEHREPWSNDDLEFVIEFTDVDTDEELALALGRTLYSIWGVQHRIRSGELTMETMRAKREREAAREVEVCSGCFTVMTPAGTCLC